MIDLETLLRVPCVESEMGFDLSPDGTRVAFSWNPEGQWDVYELLLESASQPKKVSSGAGGKFHPQYSPDGRYLAYAVDLDGSENFHIVIQELFSGQVRNLTPEMSCAHQTFFDWAPDSRQIAFISDQSGQFNVFVGSIETGIARMVLDTGYPVWKVRWSPDGSLLAVTVEACGIDYGTFIVSPRGELAEQIRIGHEPIDAGQAAWSPNGKTLAFTSDTAGYNNIGLYDIASQRVSWLTDGDGEKQFPCWAPDGKRLAYVFNRGTVSWLAIQRPGEPPILSRKEMGVHYCPEFTPDGNKLLYLFDNPGRPTDIWSLSINDLTHAQLTNSMPAEMRSTELIMPEEITYPGMDGTPVPALLFNPAGQKPLPTILIIHGGPDWLFEMTWYPLMAHLASRGWVVLAPNYRGSTGYGRSWQAASRYDFGGVDTDDVAAGALFLIKQGLADPQRIGITGRSHGGYLTTSCMTRYPELWAVGSAVVPFLNWFTNHAEIRPDLQHWDIENFGDPVENHDLWYERSPSFFLDRLTAPLQLICGGTDVRCPISDSIQARDALQSMGKVVDFVMYEDEGHIFLNIENVLDAEKRRTAFLAKYIDTKEQ